MDRQIDYDLRKQEQEDLLQELNARIFTHRTAIVGGALMREYLDKQKSMGGAELFEPMLTEQAHEYVQSMLAQACMTGTLNSLYEEMWENIKETLPEHTNVVIEALEEY